MSVCGNAQHVTGSGRSFEKAYSSRLRSGSYCQVLRLQRSSGDWIGFTFSVLSESWTMQIRETQIASLVIREVVSNEGGFCYSVCAVRKHRKLRIELGSDCVMLPILYIHSWQ